MTATSFANRAEELRQQTLRVVKLLTDKSSSLELPQPPKTLELCRQKLEENLYQVLVVGEAKRGKSTFVNALIGRDLLPTDVDIATSQVFRVCPAGREAYRLRFEDDSQMAITAADLTRYGSQVLANAGAMPRLDQIIRWIEVDVSVAFLPSNVRILDTPGLGALYAAHAQITQRFVPHADAVIFVLDSQAPISEPEVRFVEKILEVTPHVLFVQTKIDLFRKEAWQAIQQRNEDILKQRFGDQLTDARVWPISSTNLRKAAQTGDPDYQRVSRHPDLVAALESFLFKVVGWSRAAEAMLVADYYQKLAHKTLSGRLDSLKEEFRQANDATQRRIAQRQQQFAQDWGEQGDKRRKLLEEVRKITSLGKQRMLQALQPGGDIDTDQQKVIDNLATVKAVHDYGQTLSGEVASASMTRWREVVSISQKRCAELLTPFLGDVQALATLEDASAVMPSGPQLVLDDDRFARWIKKVHTAEQHAAVTGVLGFLAASVLAAPLSLVGAAALFGWIHGWNAAEQQQLTAARQELSRHLSQVLRQVQRHFFDVAVNSQHFGLVDEYFAGLERAVDEQVSKTVQQRQAEVQNEIQRLAEQARLSNEQREARAEQLRQHLAEWDALGRQIEVLGKQLQDLNRS